MNLVMSKYFANIPNPCIIQQKNSSNLADFQIFFSLFGVVLVRYCSNQLSKCKFTLDGAQIVISHKSKMNFLAMYNNLLCVRIPLDRMLYFCNKTFITMAHLQSKGRVSLKPLEISNLLFAQVLETFEIYLLKSHVLR